MGMSTHIRYVIPSTSQEFKLMLGIYSQCEEAKVTCPLKVLEFFNHEVPDPAGIMVDAKIKRCTGNTTEDRFEIEVDKIPAGVKIIRFVNAY